MKSLSVKPKYVAQIMSGAKTIELRSWPTKHRGSLLICSTQPDGHARCVVSIVDCRPFVAADADAAQSEWRDGLFAWVIGTVTPITPIPVKGKLSLFLVDDSLIHELQAAEREIPLPSLPVGGVLIA